MAGSAERKEKSMNTKKKKMKNSNKRKLSNSSDIQKPSKKSHLTNEETEKIRQECVEEVEIPEKMEIEQTKTIENHQWRNLELALSIQSKEIKPQKKVELIFDFVISRAIEKDNDEEHEFNTLSISRLMMHINNWIQSLLITSEKKIHTKDKKSDEAQFCLDFRCWQILKSCLEESSRRQVSLSASRDLLKVISCVARSTLHQLDHLDNDIKRSSFITTECQIYTTVNDCLKLLFNSHGRLLNGNLDLWTVTASSLLELVIKTFAHGLQDSDVGNLITELSCLALEQFSKFLMVHPCRKNGFRDFVEKLLEPLLHVLGMLPEHIRDDGDSMVQKLFNFVQEIVSYGLFHVVHLDEYLSLHGTERYSSLVEWKLENARTLVKSYLRHLFDKLENLVSKRKVEALSGIGEMFRLFVICVKKHKKDSQDSDALRSTGTQSTNDPSKISNLISEKSKTTSWNMRKSFFDFFVLTTEPLLLDLGMHLQSNIESKTFLNDANIALKSVNKILSTMVRERIYVRTEDDSGGACLSFFKISYGLLLSCYAKVSQLWNSSWDADILGQVEVLHSLAREFVFVIMSFLEIEYEVIGDDLVSTWLMILTFLAMGQSSEAVVELHPLSSEALNLGCRLITLYGELRQVNLALSALCRGLRHLAFYQVNDEMKSLEVSPSDLSINGDKFAKSGHLLLSAQQFRLAICNAIKSIPEGQANEYVQILSADISDSLEWMKVACSSADEHEFGDAKFRHKCSVKAEILGMVFSEIYSLILDSIPVTTGNSYRTGVSLENLIGLLGPSMSLLVDPEQDGLDPFIFSVWGITSQSDILNSKKGLQNEAPCLLLFFFRLYASCRSLYRQTLSLMPPKFTKKMSGMMADLSTAYSGDDMLEMTDFENEGYFSWVVRPSSSLLSMMNALKGSIIMQETSAYHSLIYVLHIMTLQKLGDLKRQIQCVEYIVQRSENVISSKLLDDADLSGLRKKKRKQDKFLSGLKQEAACLTGFIMEHISAIDDGKSGIYMEFGSWDLGVCTVNEKTLYTALWWIICQNIDIWCHYATKKDLKLFLSQLIFNSLTDERDENFEEISRNYTGGEMNVTKCKISQDLLCDTNFYDQRFVCRYIVSRICNVLKKLATLLFEDSSNNELSSCDWTEALSLFSNTSLAISDKPASFYCSSSDLVDKCCSKQVSSSKFYLHVAASRRLLKLLCRMMEKALSFKSFSQCLIYLVNFERLIIGSFVDPQGTLCFHEHFELLGLLVSCRRAMRYLLMTFCENSEASKSSSLGIFSENSSPYFWLLKSLNLVVGWWNSISLEHDDGRVSSMIISLMDQTSYVFVTICKHNFGLAIHSALRPKETKVSKDTEGNFLIESGSSSKSSKENKSCKSLAMIVEALEVETNAVFPFLKEAFSSRNIEAGMYKLSSVVSCIQGFIWGLECALSDIGTNYKDLKAKLMKHNYKTMSRVINFLDMIVRFIGESSQIFLCSDALVTSSCDDQDLQNVKNVKNGSHGLRTDASLNEPFVSGSEFSEMPLASSEFQIAPGCSGTSRVELETLSYNHLRMDLLQSFLSGENLEAAYFLRRLLISTSGIMRLSMLFKCSPLSSNTVQNLLGCSGFLLTKFSQMPGMPNSYTFLWLDGTAQFLEALGSQFPLTKNVYTKLVELNINAIGKCISLQGKGATSMSHDIESITKLLTKNQVLEPTLSGPLYGLDDVKRRLRNSFKVLIEKPSELHLLSVVQALQQALTGNRVGLTAICDLQMGITEGGIVSPMVAAGVDCLDLLLEFLKGNKLWSLVKIQLNSLIASLFNIVVHLQGATLFYGRPNSTDGNNSPDSGSVVLMCVELLTRIAGKPTLFHLESHHVSQSLHIPGILFQSFRSLKAGEASHLSVTGSKDHKVYDHFGLGFLVDRVFSMNLYVASCRLLWTVVKHHKSDCVRCIILLQTSLQALLHCLEHLSTDTTDNFTWEVEEGVKCASYLRRVYEEIRQQKDVFGQHGFKFLSDYICVFSGYGLLKQGLKREVDEALRPGVYALIDICSPDDLQHLHTVFGEGPRRSTLASLKHDYEHNFKYGGKV
ncbi:uncharacterized protein LOC141648325 [Silene latifolia]|uniref:uncharacterized protein LOC141648325 n=1 Tax=Silene latifolia TaxID=37657 RepID=UPI003D780860